MPPDVLERTVRNYTDSPLVGTPEQIVERLSELQDAAGMTYAIANFPEAAYDDGGIGLFAEQVIPALRLSSPPFSADQGRLISTRKSEVRHRRVAGVKVSLTS